MKKLDARQELLVITMEECGELIQSCSKALRRGKLFDDTELKQEIADVQAMINLMVEWDVLSWTEIEDGVERKRNKLARWSKLIDDGEVYAEDIEDEVHEVEKPHPPKSEQQVSVSAYGVTWTQDMTGTGAYINMPGDDIADKSWRKKL